MFLSCSEFDTHLEKNSLVLTLIGMSGMGKTYRSKQMEAYGFTRLSSDDFIETQLLAMVRAGIAGVAEWMGQPYEPHHQQHCTKYLAWEERSIISFLRKTNRGNTVIDTTGSVMYLSPKILDALHQQTLMVYLEASQTVKDKLFQVYMTDPKPVVWGESFYKLPDESDREALQRCYPMLLDFRAARYAALADVTLPFEIARNEQSTAEEFLQEIRRVLTP
jgi:shikimate kinase